MRVAAIQMCSNNDVVHNLSSAAALIKAAKRNGARLAVLPENFALMPLNEADYIDAAESDNGGPIQEFLQNQAMQHGIWIIGGTIPIRVQGSAQAYSRSLVFNDRGRRVTHYDKMHLFDVDLGSGECHRESDFFMPGLRPTVFDSPLGRMGIAICYDLRFPELFRAMLDEGAEVFAIPAAFTAATGKVHWDALLRARAIENLSHVIAAGQTGRHANGRETWGHSTIVGPWGEALCEMGNETGIVCAEINQEGTRHVRDRLPSIVHRRFRVIPAPA